jgi:hypothetical protein
VSFVRDDLSFKLEKTSNPSRVATIFYLLFHDLFCVWFIK